MLFDVSGPNIKIELMIFFCFSLSFVGIAVSLFTPWMSAHPDDRGLVRHTLRQLGLGAIYVALSLSTWLPSAMPALLTPTFILVLLTNSEIDVGVMVGAMQQCKEKCPELFKKNLRLSYSRLSSARDLSEREKLNVLFVLLNCIHLVDRRLFKELRRKFKNILADAENTSVATAMTIFLDVYDTPGSVAKCREVKMLLPLFENICSSGHLFLVDFIVQVSGTAGREVPPAIIRYLERKADQATYGTHQFCFYAICYSLHLLQSGKVSQARAHLSLSLESLKMQPNGDLCNRMVSSLVKEIYARAFLPEHPETAREIASSFSLMAAESFGVDTHLVQRRKLLLCEINSLLPGHLENLSENAKKTGKIRFDYSNLDLSLCEGSIQFSERLSEVQGYHYTIPSMAFSLEASWPYAHSFLIQRSRATFEGGVDLLPPQPGCPLGLLLHLSAHESLQEAAIFEGANSPLVASLAFRFLKMCIKNSLFFNMFQSSDLHNMLSKVTFTSKGPFSDCLHAQKHIIKAHLSLIDLMIKLDVEESVNQEEESTTIHQYLDMAKNILETKPMPRSTIQYFFEVALSLYDVIGDAAGAEKCRQERERLYTHMAAVDVEEHNQVMARWRLKVTTYGSPSSNFPPY